jgi:AcrR family transcriptional regulator
MGKRARHDEILDAALRVATLVGYNRMTRDDIALAAQCSPALVSEVLGTMPALRRCVMRQAVARGVLAVVAQGLALRDVYAMRAPESVRLAAARTLAVV